MAVHPLRRVLTLQPLVAIILPFMVVLACGFIWVLPQVRADIETRQRQLARAVGQQVESHLHTGAALVRAAAINYRSDRDYSHDLTSLLNVSDSISSLYLVAGDGTVKDVALRLGSEMHKEDLLGLDLSANPLFLELVKSGQSHWSKTFLSVVHGGLVAAYGIPLAEGALIGEVDLDLLSEFLHHISSEEELLILIVDQDGQVIADNRGDYTAQQLNIANAALVRRELEPRGGATGEVNFDGVDMIGSIAPIQSVDWRILVAKGRFPLYRTVVEIAIVVFGGVLAALAVGVLLSMVIASRLVLRFSELNRHAQRIVEGGLADEWPRSAIEEFNLLSDNLQRMARRLQDSELLYRTLFEQLPEGVVLWGIAAVTPLQFNTAAHRLLGYTREEFAAIRVVDFHVADSDQEFLDHQRRLMEKGRLNFEAQHRTKTGDIRDMLVTLQVLELADEQLILAIHRDITDSKRAVEEIKDINALLSVFIQRSPVYTFIKEVSEQESRVLLASENYRDMIGIPGSQMAGKTMAELFPAQLAAGMVADDWQVVSRGEVLEVEEELNGRSYTSIKFPIIQKNRTLLAGYTIDITERKQAEEERINLEKQLLHVQKLESLGVLAGGIAHDFNNILLAITGNADMALRRIGKGHAPTEHLQRIKQAADKAADLAKQMLAYSGKGQFKVEVLDLNLLLEEMLQMLNVSISKTAELKISLHEPLPAIEADATQIRQIVMNLVINASEAIGDKSGIITITTSSESCRNKDFMPLWRDEDVPGGDCVCLSVTDTGCGMTKETLARLFDPFFTTKFTGRGLGMAAVQGIVRGHRGAIKVDSEPGQGSCFRIFLPASKETVLVAEELGPQPTWQGTGTILLVDDEETVRSVGSEMLRELGFTVLTANDGKEALEVYQLHPEIDLVILDMTMPRMDGEQCFHALQQLSPGLKVIMSSGYSEVGNTKKLLGCGLAGFIQKPYWFDTLRDALRNVFE